MAPIQGRGRAWAHASSLFRRAGNGPLVQNGSVLRLGTEANRLLVDVQSDIVNSSHTVLLTWFVSQPTTAGLTSIFAQPSGGPPLP